MTQETLHVYRHLAVLGGLGKERAVKVPVDQPREVIDGGVNVR